MATKKMKLRVRKKPAASSITQAMSAEASPDSKCPICLDKFKNMAYLDLCLHKFCFRCIHEWSKNKAECPLCKQPFNSIFHSIKAENDFKKYDLRPTENGSFGNLGGQRFRYRTTLTGNRRRPQRRTSPPPDNGVMFESLAAPASPRQDRSLHRMMMRLAARRRAENEGRAMRALQEQEMIKFRRALYRRGVRVRSVRDNGRTRDTSAEFFQRNPACLHRLVPWLKRELIVLYGAHGSLVNIVQHIIMSQITRYNIEDDTIVQELRPFLQARTEHFVHEFINFARSPYNMEAYDQHAVYDCPAPSSEEDSSSNSSVIAISEDEEDSMGLNSNPNSMSGSTLSQTPWDDETPGPSYSTEPVQTLALSVRDSDSESSVEEADGPVATEGTPPVTANASVQERDHASSGEDDCLIVGYVKPMAERTPELVQLSSDSEESVKDENTPVPKQPQHIHFRSEPNSPASVGSSSTKSIPNESPRQTDERENDRNTPEKVIDPGSPEGSPSSDQRASLSLVLSRHKRPEDRADRRHRIRGRTRSRSRSGSWSRSRSHDRSCHSNRRRSKSHSRDRLREGSHPDRRHDRHGGDHSGRGREAAPHAYHWHSYSHYSCERDRSRKHYTEQRSSYTSYYVSPDRRSHPQSRSRSRSHSRESRWRDRRRSRSRSSSDSRSSHRKSKHEKPGGKRKYKTRHLEEPAPKNGAPKQHESAEDGVKERKSSKERHRKRSKERSMIRSPSVEIVYEGKSGEQTRRHHKKKKKHKKKSKRHRSRDRTSKHSPVVITIDSDSDHATNTKHFTCATVDNSDIDDPIPNLSPPLVSSSNPADSCLLDSILQQWEQQFPTVNQNAGASVMTDPPDPLTGEPDPVIDPPHPLSRQPDLLINQSGPLANQTGYLTEELDTLTGPPNLLTDPPHSVSCEPSPLINKPDLSTDMPEGLTNDKLDPLVDPATPLSDPLHPSRDEPGPLTHQLQPLVEQPDHLTNQQNSLNEPHNPVAHPLDKQEPIGGMGDVPLTDC